MTYIQFDKILSLVIIPLLVWMLWISYKSILSSWNDSDKKAARNGSIFFFILGLVLLMVMIYSAFLKITKI